MHFQHNEKTFWDMDDRELTLCAVVKTDEMLDTQATFPISNIYERFGYPVLFTTWARFPLFSQGIKFNIPYSLSTI